ALARLVGAVYGFSGELWRAQAGALSTMLRETTSKLAAEGVSDEDVNGLVDDLTVAADGIRSLTSRIDAVGTVRGFADRLHKDPEALAKLLESGADALLAFMKEWKPLVPNQWAESAPKVPTESPDASRPTFRSWSTTSQFIAIALTAAVAILLIL